MKKVVGSLLLCLAATSAFGRIESVQVTAGQLETGLCMAALDSMEYMYQLSQQELGAPIDQTELQCNGMPVKAWVTRTKLEEQARNTFVTVKATNQSPETQLCLAALESDEALVAAREALFSYETGIEQDLECNGMPLSRFVTKYRVLVDEITTN